jgi:hypothetical protein
MKPLHLKKLAKALEEDTKSRVGLRFSVYESEISGDGFRGSFEEVVQHEARHEARVKEAALEAKMSSSSPSSDGHTPSHHHHHHHLHPRNSAAAKRLKKFHGYQTSDGLFRGTFQQALAREKAGVGGGGSSGGGKEEEEEVEEEEKNSNNDDGDDDHFRRDQRHMVVSQFFMSCLFRVLDPFPTFCFVLDPL